MRRYATRNKPFAHSAGLEKAGLLAIAAPRQVSSSLFALPWFVTIIDGSQRRSTNRTGYGEIPS
jgi:hypothetical protein